MSLIASDQLKIVIGLGVTGISCVELLVAKGDNFIVLDTRENPPKLAQFQKDYPQVKVILGDLDKELLASASELIISPGIAKEDAAIAYAVAKGAKLVGDIDLFCREITAPVIAITGSNAKTTVTTLIGEMAVANGLDVGVGGNIGVPVLEFLKQPQKQLYVLELSSFQLETTHELRADVATVLNITPDHLDRYDNDFKQYYQAKHRIFKGCKSVVENLDDPLTHPLLPSQVKVTGYRLGRSDFNIFGLLEVESDGQNSTHLALAGEPIMAISEIKLPGKHNIANALAALAIGHNAGFEIAAMCSAIRDFSGLEHRCQLVAEKQGVQYFDDSKGTNVGATVAAIEGLGSALQKSEKIILIAGGDGKGAAFDELTAPVENYVKSVVLIGTDAQRIAQVLPNSELFYAQSMQQAVEKCASLSQQGDVVLLSPACASFDMFDSYGHRGDVFSEAARNL